MDVAMQTEGSRNPNSDVVRDAFHQWFEQQAMPEFKVINQKLDSLLAKSCEAYQIRSCQSGFSRVGSRAGTLRGSEPSSVPSPDASQSSGPSMLAHILLAPATSANIRQSRQSVRSKRYTMSGLLGGAQDGGEQHDDDDAPGRPGCSSRNVRQILPEGCQVVPEGDEAAAKAPVTRRERNEKYGRKGMTLEDMDHIAEQLVFKDRFFAWLDTLWGTLDDPEYNAVARWLGRLMPGFILTTVFVTLSQLLDGPPLGAATAAALETSIDAIFLLEFVARFASCPNRSVFCCGFHNVIDLLAGIPLALRAAEGFVLPRGPVEGPAQALLLCVVPIVRLLKLLRRFEKLHLLLRAFKLALEVLPVLLFMLFLITMLFSMMIYLVEPRENITYLSTAVWLTIVTMTTVGYGDVIPQSIAGSAITGVLIVITVLYMAIPLGIIGNAFTQTWSERDRILLTERTRQRLRQWGYEAQDIPILFHVSSQSARKAFPNGAINEESASQLTYSEFRDLIRRMKLGFNEERILQLFMSIDTDRTGTIDDKEFVRNLFPSSFHSIYHS